MSAIASRSRMLRVNATLRRDLRDALTALDRTRAILAGRAEPPTDAEIVVHYTVGGRWMHIDEADSAGSLCESAWEVHLLRFRAGRWWALDASGAPCAWPTTHATSGDSP